MTMSLVSSTVAAASPLPAAPPPLAMVATPSTVAVKPVSSTSRYSKSIPFLQRPQHLDGHFAGDVGFDPLGLASSPERLQYYREAEIKHARLAMLAAAGWPLSELLDGPLTRIIDDQFGWNLSSALDEADRVPSLLNGGMGDISPWWWGFCLGTAAAIDVRGIQNTRYSADDGKNHLPGDYGFDPLRLYPRDDEAKARMQLAEVKHGRLAMLAVTGFAAQEFVSKLGVVDETPIFFRPFHF